MEKEFVVMLQSVMIFGFIAGFYGIEIISYLRKKRIFKKVSKKD